MAGREWKDTYKIEALLTGDTSSLKAAIKNAQRMMKQLENSSTDDIEIDADDKPLSNRIKIAKAKIRQLKSESADIDINGDNSDFNRKIEQSKKMVQALENKSHAIEFGLNNLDTIKKLQNIKLKRIQADDVKFSVKPELETKAVYSQIDRFKAMLRSIPNKIRTRVEVNKDLPHHINLLRQLGKVTDEFQGTMSRMARSIESFGTVLSNQIMGSLLMMSTSLIPIIATLVPVVMALGNAIGVLGGGLGGLITAFATATAVGVGFGGMMATVLARYNSDTFQATKESRQFTKALDGIKSAWNGIVDTHQAEIFDIMTRGLQGLTSALNQLKPMFAGVTQVMSEASGKFQEFISNSSIAKDFFNMLNTTGVSVFGTLLNAVGKFGAGLMQTITNMTPLMTYLASGFENLGQRFMEWSQKVETQQGFQKFAEYVQQALPIIGSIFGSTFQGIINLFSAFGDNSLIIFESLAQMAERFKQWSATIKQSDGFQQFIDYVQEHGGTVISLIGNIIMTIVNLGIALAPLGAKVLEMTNAFFEFTSELLKNHPIIGLLIGAFTVLAGAFLMILPVLAQVKSLFTTLIAPLTSLFKQGTLVSTAMNILKGAFGLVSGTVLAVIAVLALLVGSFIALWNTNEGFRTRVIEIWNTIKEHISNAVQAVSNFLKEIWGGLVEWWNQNNQNILQVALTVWNAILDVVEAAMAFIVPIVQIAWEKIKMVIQIALEIIKGVIGAFFAVLNGDWKGAWEAIKTAALNIWNILKEGINNILNVLLGLIGSNVEGMKTWLSNAWEAIKNRALLVWNVIKTMLVALVKEIASRISENFQRVQTFLSNIWNAIKTRAITIWNAVKTALISIVQNIVQNAQNKFNNFKTAVSNIWNAIRSTASNVWNAIKNFVVSTVQNLVQRAVLHFHRMRGRVQQTFNRIKFIARSVWNTIKSTIQNVVQNILSAVRSRFNSMRSTVTSIFNNIRSTASNVWNSIKSTISNVISNIVSAVRSRFNSMRSTIVSIFNNIRSTASSVWNNIRSTISNIVNNIKSTIQRIFNSLAGIVRSAFSRVRSAVSNGMTRAYNAVTRMFGRFRQAGSNIVGSIADGIRGAIGKVTGAIDSVVGAVRDFLPFSPAKRGPLRDIMKTNVGGSVAETIRKQRNLPIRQMQTMTKKMNGVLNGFSPSINPIDTQMGDMRRSLRNAQLTARASMNHNIETQMQAPSQSLTAHLHMGTRDWKTHISDVSKQQSQTARLEEDYDV